MRDNIKTMNDLREMLSVKMDGLADKEDTASNVNAICNATGKYLSTVKLEMEFAKMVGVSPSPAFLALMDNPRKSMAIVKEKLLKKAA